MELTITHVDAFTNKPFAGNPAAVCLLPEPRDAHWMQLVAHEMNLSETAFLSEERDGFRLRWFTPTVEVDLCGHATLASAHILWQEGCLKTDQQARFYTRSGLLMAKHQGDWIELDFPALVERPAPPPVGLVEALGVRPTYVGKSTSDYLIEVDSEKTVQTLKPNFTLLAELPVRGIMVTSRSKSSEFDFLSRFFAPRVGINEDPVTGAAHCCLGPFWQARLKKDTLIAYQASPRGGVVRVRVGKERVYLSGQAITVLCGKLTERASSI